MAAKCLIKPTSAFPARQLRDFRPVAQLACRLVGVLREVEVLFRVGDFDAVRAAGLPDAFDDEVAAGQAVVVLHVDMELDAPGHAARRIVVGEGAVVVLLAVEDVVFFGELGQRLGEQLFDVAGVVAVAEVEVEEDAGDGVLVRPVHEGAGDEVGVRQDDAFVVEGGDGQRAHADALDRAFVVADGDDVAVAQGALNQQQDAADEVVGNRLHAEADPDTERTGEDGEGGEVDADDAQREEEAEGNGGVLAEDGEAVPDAEIGDFVVEPAVAEGFYPAADAVDDVEEDAHQQDVEQGEVAVVAFGDGSFEQGQGFLDDRGVRPSRRRLAAGGG